MSENGIVRGRGERRDFQCSAVIDGESREMALYPCQKLTTTIRTGLVWRVHKPTNLVTFYVDGIRKALLG